MSFWVTEAAAGFGMTVEVEETLLVRQTPFQKIELYRTNKLGKILLLDGIIQLTLYDEFAYHEMMAHLPVFACRDPRRALVIGGGDGGVLRELGRHASLETLDICEIDAEVIAAAREFLPETACGFNDPRVNIHIADGSEFIRSRPGYYDVIIVDSTDPGGPGTPLFGEAFYRDMKQALRPGGVIATQAESGYLHAPIVGRLTRLTRQIFQYGGYATILVPTYPTGIIGTCVGSDGGDVREPKRPVPPELARQLRYYTSEIHRAAFVQPAFVNQLFEEN